MTTIVLAPHPDDEVLGCSWVLRGESPLHIVYATDGVPPWTAREQRDLVRRERTREAEAAWNVLGARVLGAIGLRYQDLAAWRSVGALADSLERVVRRLSAKRVYVPALEQGHPDHDACHVAAGLVIPRVKALAREWYVYSLYGYPLGTTELRFGRLDPGPYPDGRVVASSADELSAKARSLACFETQLAHDSVLRRWMDQPQPEAIAPFVFRHPPPNPGTTYYERELHFDDHGICGRRVNHTLRHAITAATDSIESSSR